MKYLRITLLSIYVFFSAACGNEASKSDAPKGADAAALKDEKDEEKEVAKDDSEDPAIWDLQPNEWVDAVTEKRWLIGAAGNFSAAKSSCSGKYRLPNLEEAKSAAQHGIRAIAKSLGMHQDFWSSEVVNNMAKAITANTSGVPQVFEATTEDQAMIGIFCIRD